MTCLYATFLIQGVQCVQNRHLLYCMGVQRFYGKGLHLLLWAGARVASGNVTSGIRNGVNYCEIFNVYT